MRYRYQLVDRIPAKLQEGIVYHTEEFELAGLLCACGCGHRIILLVPDGHKVRDIDGYATIRPSVGVLDAACKSHYVISKGKVHWLPAFKDAHAAKIMHAQIARHVARDPEPGFGSQKSKSTVRRVLRKLRAFFTQG